MNLYHTASLPLPFSVVKSVSPFHAFRFWSCRLWLTSPLPMLGNRWSLGRQSWVRFRALPLVACALHGAAGFYLHLLGEKQA